MRHTRRAVTVLIMSAVAILLPSAASAEEAVSGGWIQSQIDFLDDLLGATVGLIFQFLFFDFGTGFPLIIAILVAGGVYYTGPLDTYPSPRD